MQRRVDSGSLAVLRRQLVAAAVMLVSAGGISRSFADEQPVRVEVAATAPSTPELIAFLDPGLNAGAFAATHGLELLFLLRSDPDAYVFSAGTPARAEALTLGLLPGVRWSALNQQTQAVKLFFPNDRYFPKDGGGVGQPGQWHLVNQHVPGRDAGVQGAWALGYTGAGVTIGIVDDSVEVAHEDLAPNVVMADSWDFGGNDPDPSPAVASDIHGISVAGVAAARGGNSLGVTGAAPFAGLAGLRINFGSQTSQMFIDATLHHSSGSNTNIKVKNHSYGYNISFFTNSGINGEQTALSTSADAGTIHVIAAGNGRGGSLVDDSNKLDLQNHPQAITVAALASHGSFSIYSSFGANLFVTAPSDTGGAFLAITTTDRTGSGGYNDFPGDDKYTDIFGGTSSAAPLVAGVLALANEAQPNLDVRFAKHLLARTSIRVLPGDLSVVGGGDGVTPGSAWQTNAAGFTFNHNFGFGLVNAEALVEQAVLYQGVTPLQTYFSGTMNVNQALPDSNLTGVTRLTNVSVSGLLEEVMITLDITHTGRGDIEAFLTSPMGTTSRIVYRNEPDGGDNIVNWEFTSNAFWGEDPFGAWSLMVRDVFFPQDTGTWNSWALDLNMDTLVVPEPAGAIILVGGALLLMRRRCGAGLQARR